MKATPATKISDVKRAWHLIDLNEKVLGRIATDIAKLLMGKAKPYFVRNLDCGDYVVVVNAKHVFVTGKKEEKKIYARHSGFPGGFRQETLREVRGRKPEEIIRHAVKGMLPQNKLRDAVLRRLFIFSEATHTYQEKFSSKGRSASG
ncbi:MAG TPA: 50S ribosomal protein L13 [Patescibacteria group bacterium]|nr:50S ribosomal protein L13 [Patescibacteria group bacterium]